ncbi:MAG: hypothetical protein HC831_11675, partial [Chloroflexia bacterium]|nr:hypothetical protein [Chloroflexia bacterium]
IGRGMSSPYKMYVNGIESIQLRDIGILGNDSILILVEVFIDPQNENSPYLVNDSIVFETNGKKQDSQTNKPGVTGCQLPWKCSINHAILPGQNKRPICHLSVRYLIELALAN